VKTVVKVVQAIAVLGSAVFLVMLFLNEPEDVEAAPEAPSSDDAAEDIDAASLFDDRCAGCHGPDGGGGIGPQLSEGRAAAAFPNIEDQIVVVTEGRGSMPSFGGRLGEDEIRAVVAYSRTL
jgi:mono/diheme cytochrome c family protein